MENAESGGQCVVKLGPAAPGAASPTQFPAEQRDWLSKMQERVASITSRYPVPDDVAPGMWQLVLFYAAHQEGGIAQLCLERGRVWGSRDVRGDVQRGAMKHCFKNAGNLWLEDESLTYVEGYACTSKVGLAVHHAWTVDASGMVVDPTWANGVAYCGVPVKRSALREILSTSRRWGVFANTKAPDWVFTDYDRWMGDAAGRRPTVATPGS